MYKKIVFLIALLLPLMLVFSACAAPAVHEVVADPDTGVIFFENGTIYTADEQGTVAQALAIEDGKIIFVGSAEDGRAYRETAEEIVDLKGGMLLPGFIDCHIHSVTPAFFDFTLLDDFDVESALKTIEKYIKANPDQDSYTGFGYNTDMFEGEELQKGPRKELLDEICPDKPLFIYSYDGHAAWLNSKCFEQSGITAQTQSTPGGAIEKDEVTGALWGTLKDTAMSLLPPVELPEEKLAASLQEFHAGLNALGYTSIMTLPGNGFFPVPWEGYAYLEENNLLTLRVRGAGLVTSWQTEEDIAAVKELKQQYGSELLAMTTAKIFADGVVDSESALLLEPYTDNPSSYGTAVWTQDALSAALAEINTAGVQGHTHAIGDAAVRMALDAAQYAADHAPAGDYRNAITHLQLVSAGDIPRFSELDVIAVAQPYWMLKAGSFWVDIEYATLGERAEKEYPMKSFLDSGARLVFSSDYPVTELPDPFDAIEAGVTRNLVDGEAVGVADITDINDPEYLLWPEERLTVEEMIRGFTADAAYSIFAEDVTGTLEAGKSADMVVIDQDILAIDPLAISDTQVLQTYLKGQLVYSDK